MVGVNIRVAEGRLVDRPAARPQEGFGPEATLIRTFPDRRLQRRGDAATCQIIFRRRLGTMKHLFRGLATLVAVTAFVAVVGSIGSASNRAAGCSPVDQQYGGCGGKDKPAFSYDILTDITVHVDTSACSGFAPSDLVLSGRLAAHYKHWATEDIFGEEEGWADLNVSAGVSGHTYLVHQRYWYPRRFREYIYGWATTVVMRDDGASMRGYAQLGIRADHNTEGINWESVPTCSPPHH
jgi:hypothetical protein